MAKAARGARYVAMLRGINVGGKNIVSMARLRDLVNDAGGDEVQTHLNSGNVLFAAPTKAVAEKIRTRVETALEAESGRRIGIVLRSHAELGRTVEREPFPDADPSRVLVSFLSSPLSASALAKLEAVESGDDEVVVHGRELYLHCQAGINQSKLALAASKPGGDTVATARNWRTVTKLFELSGPASAP